MFLQNWRSAIIPLVAVPVAIIGTFAVMAAMGFSLNNLTLFGLVLANVQSQELNFCGFCTIIHVAGTVN